MFVARPPAWRVHRWTAIAAKGVDTASLCSLPVSLRFPPSARAFIIVRERALSLFMSKSDGITQQSTYTSWPEAHLCIYPLSLGGLADSAPTLHSNLHQLHPHFPTGRPRTRHLWGRTSKRRQQLCRTRTRQCSITTGSSPVGGGVTCTRTSPRATAWNLPTCPGLGMCREGLEGDGLLVTR